MLRWLRGVRVDYRTGILILALALIVWGVVTYVRIRDFIPPELPEPVGPTRAPEAAPP